MKLIFAIFSRLNSRTNGVVKEISKVLASAPRAFRLVWDASPFLTGFNLTINVASAFLPIVGLWTTKLLIDRVAALIQARSVVADMRALWLLLGLLAAIWIAQRASQSATEVLNGLLRFQVEQHSQTLIMRKCAEFDLAFFENPRNLNTLESASQGALSSAWTVVQMVFSLVRSTIMMCTFAGVLIRLHWLVALAVIMTAAPQMIVTSYFARKRWKMMLDRAEDSRLRFYIGWLMTQRDPAKEVRIFDLSENLLDRFRFFAKKFFQQEGDFARRSQCTSFGFGILGVFGVLCTWVYIILRAISKTITIGDVFLYTQAISSAQSGLVSLFTQGGQMYEHTLFLNNLFSVLDLKPGEVEGALHGPPGSSARWGNIIVPKRVQHGIEFRNVSFSYPGSDTVVLSGLSFHVEPNQSVAIVGENGAGKTTVVKLLSRLYDPVEGTILLDGKDIREYDLAQYRQLFAVIFQDFTHYWLTLRENVGFGDVRRIEDLRQIRKASAQAGVEEIAQRLPQEYETYLARQFFGLGVDLSGGEWQKVALARAYMRDCPILILDEPTASLDAFAEREVYTSFGEQMAGRMIFLISHRFSTVRMANHILVLDEGRLIEKGDHDQLIRRSGLYASMFETQALNYR